LTKTARQVIGASTVGRSGVVPYHDDRRRW